MSSNLRATGLITALLLAVAGLATTTPSADAREGAVASCRGFANRVGITDRTITIANVSDLTGVAPDQYRSATQAVRAYVAYFNANARICGRKLKLLALDSGGDPTREKAATVTACRSAFAAIGSASTADDGGAARAQLCRLPDLRAQAMTPARYQCSTCFATNTVEPFTFANAVPDYFLTHAPAASQAAGMVYLNADPWAGRAEKTGLAEDARGWTFNRIDGIDLAEFNYSPHVAQLKSAGVKLVQFVGYPAAATRLAQAMDSAAYSPDVFLLDSDLLGRVGGPAFEGAYVPVNITANAKNAELVRYRTWLHKVAPGAQPTASGYFAWSAARLFTEQARALGGRLNRPNLVAALRNVHRWTDLGLHAGQDVGGKKNGNCWRLLRRTDGVWAPVGGTTYRCTGKTGG